MQKQSSCLLLYISLFLIMAAANSCTRPIQYIYQDEVTDGYLSGHPVGAAGPYLKEMQQSVIRISSTSRYITHFFDPADQVRVEDILDQEQMSRLSLQEFEDQTTSSGTAIVIYNRQNRIGLLTTNHIVSSPDTLYEYTDETERFLESITYKTDQIIWMMGFSSAGRLEVLASDRTADLAILGTRVDTDELDKSVDEQFPVFPYPFGDTSRLTPGVFIYAMGYPRGYPMVTSGIVGTTEYGRGRSFVTDAMFNRGFSGGAVIGIKGGIPQFELLGIARSASGTSEWAIIPDEEEAYEHHIRRPYGGELFLERKTRIDYGITHVISAQQIMRFLDEHASDLSSRGYGITY